MVAAAAEGMRHAGAPRCALVHETHETLETHEARGRQTAWVVGAYLDPDMVGDGGVAGDTVVAIFGFVMSKPT